MDEGMEKYKIIDSHAHPGYEKKDIEKRPGCAPLWLGDDYVNHYLMDVRAAFGFPEPYKPIYKIEEIPDFNVEHWVRHMDEVGISHMGLQCMDCESDPPANFRWLVPYEYVKEEFIDKYPDRFWGIGGIHYKLGPEHSLEQVDKAKEFGFLGVKMYTVMEGYPNDREKCYPIYERLIKFGLHAEFHCGQEDVPGARMKYTDPVYIQDIAQDFPDLKIVQLHCGFGISPERALWNCVFHDNIYTDVTTTPPQWMDLKYCHDVETWRFMERLIPDKVWFGSDFPIFYPSTDGTIARIKSSPLSAEFKYKLLRGNAENFFLRGGNVKQKS